jgi:hypothetical protein
VALYDAYESMRASSPLANTLPLRLEFFGIERRRIKPILSLQGKNPGMMRVPWIAGKR